MRVGGQWEFLCWSRICAQKLIAGYLYTLLLPDHWHSLLESVWTFISHHADSGAHTTQNHFTHSPPRWWTHAHLRGFNRPHDGVMKYLVNYSFKIYHTTYNRSYILKYTILCFRLLIIFSELCPMVSIDSCDYIMWYKQYILFRKTLLFAFKNG